jgi:hypothetical protein
MYERDLKEINAIIIYIFILTDKACFFYAFDGDSRMEKMKAVLGSMNLLI